jgi:hypothetical protein
MTKFSTIMTAYTIVGLLSFGWLYNHPSKPRPVCLPEEHLGGQLSAVCVGDQERWDNSQFYGSLLAGALWPVLWSLKLSIAITKWP